MKDHSSTKFADLEYMMSKIENYEKFLQVKVDGNLEDDDKEEDNDSLREIQQIKKCALNTKADYINFKVNLIDLMTQPQNKLCNYNDVKSLVIDKIKSQYTEIKLYTE